MDLFLFIVPFPPTFSENFRALKVNIIPNETALCCYSKKGRQVIKSYNILQYCIVRARSTNPDVDLGFSMGKSSLSSR